MFVTAIHGDEILPALALASVGEAPIIANPQAVSRGIRFIERDLNASFATEGNTIEEQQARKLLETIPTDAFVIDFHTFSCESPPFCIVVDKKNILVASQLGCMHVVYMKHNIKKGHALINVRDGISVEVGKHHDPRSFAETLRIRDRLREQNKAAECTVYEVYDVIARPGDYTNFVVQSEGEEYFYPVLAGEQAYKREGIYGLKARKIQYNKELL